MASERGERHVAGQVVIPSVAPGTVQTETGKRQNRT